MIQIEDGLQMKNMAELSMRSISVTIGLMGMLFCSPHMQAANAEECELPFVMGLQELIMCLILGRYLEMMLMFQAENLIMLQIIPGLMLLM